MKNRTLFGAVILTIATALACTVSDEVLAPVNGVGFDEGTVSTIRIGNQVWMAKNLEVTVDSSGRAINAVAYNHDSSLVNRYGRLYTLEEAQRACPAGWRLPTMQDWQNLFDQLGGMSEAGGRMKTVEYWDAPNVGASNSSGFSVFPAGGASASDQFDGLGYAAHFWSDSGSDTTAEVPSLMNSRADVYILNLNRSMKASVRYIRN